VEVDSRQEYDYNPAMVIDRSIALSLSHCNVKFHPLASNFSSFLGQQAASLNFRSPFPWRQAKLFQMNGRIEDQHGSPGGAKRQSALTSVGDGCRNNYLNR